MSENETDLSSEMEKQIQHLLTDATEWEHNARRRAFYLTVIPAALACILLMGTGLQMRSANQEVSVARSELSDVQMELQSVNLALDNTTDALEEANQEVVTARQSLTETLTTLEIVTGDLVMTRDQLAQTENEMESLQVEYGALEQKVSRYNERIIELNKQIEELEQSLESVREELRAATDIQRYTFAGDWLLTVKNIATVYPAAGDLLQTIVELQDMRWKTGGFSPDEGFDSPSFAAFVLEVNQRLALENPNDRYALNTLLPVRREAPQVGDIVFYEGGYTMFYFVDERGVPFVIGMTTQGVLALTPDFAQVKGYGTTAP